MVIDSSALVAIMIGEDERRQFIDAITAAQTRLIGAPTLVETGMVVLSRCGESGLNNLHEFCERGEITVAPFSSDHTNLAIDAFRRFGKGRHPAGLNLGDCFSYALAKATGETLLFKGADFPQTDIKPAF